MSRNNMKMWQNPRLFASSSVDSTNSCDGGDNSDQQSVSPPEPMIIALDSSENVKKKQLKKCKIVIREADDYCLISGQPIEVTCTRPARIHQPSKNAQQQGTRHLGHWLLDFETKERWENPLMGWCSSGDALSNVQMQFSTKEEAIDYCKKNSMTYRVDESKTLKKYKVVKSYRLNFHCIKRTRVSMK